MKDAPMTWKRLGFIILLWILVLLPREGGAALFEQMIVETRAQSLGGAVTADPRGLCPFISTLRGWTGFAGRNLPWELPGFPS